MGIKVLGISAYYHDAAAAIIEDGNIIAAAEEERFTRIKGDANFPHNAINFCLNIVNTKIENIDYIVFYEDYITKFDRILTTNYATAPKSLVSYLSSMPKWISSNLWLENEITRELGIKKKIIFGNHHMSHAASAFYPSPFEEAAILTIDGVGEWQTATYGFGKKNEIKLLGETKFPNSLGLLYSAFTYYTGFKINSGEYKMMGLAPYGEPKYVDLIKKELIHINADGTVILNQKYFSYTTGLKTINNKFCKLFGGKPRKPESEITQKDADLAASIQVICNESILKMAEFVYRQTKCDNLVMAGGVALNVVSNGYLRDNGPFKNIWIQPAASDGGGALGAALWYWYKELNNKREIEKLDSMQSAYLGPEIKNLDEDDTIYLNKMGAKYEVLAEKDLVKRIAKLLTENKVIAIARGRMEFGPRALGNRSIIASAIDEEMQSKLNIKVKKRESFRPFAPMVLKEDANEYFKFSYPSPYMLFTSYVKEELRCDFEKKANIYKTVNQVKSTIPAVTHVDYSSRVQTVEKERNIFMYNVLKEYKKSTKTSVIVNTSFNLRGEPIVNTTSDAYNCFMTTDIDYLVIGNRLLNKNDQPVYKAKKGRINLD